MAKVSVLAFPSLGRTTAL